MNAAAVPAWALIVAVPAGLGGTRNGWSGWKLCPGAAALPGRRPLRRIDQRPERALDHRNVGPAGDLQEAQQIAGLLVQPAIAGDDGETQHLDVRIADQRQDVGAGRAIEVVVINDQLWGDRLRRRDRRRRRHQPRRQKPRRQKPRLARADRRRPFRCLQATHFLVPFILKVPTPDRRQDHA
jgi:hypothetical protein